MSAILQLHWQFVQDVLHSSKLDSTLYTTLPSFVFLISTFVLLYFQIHQNTTSFTRWNARIYKDVFFHWIYFYLSRAWFMFVKFARYIITALDEYVKATSPKEEIAINLILTHTCIFMLVLTVSVIPLLIIAVQEMYTRHVPNFLMWTRFAKHWLLQVKSELLTEYYRNKLNINEKYRVAEDPWVRSEIGTAGHYLERPVVARINNRSKSAYRSKRSSSFENAFANKDSKAFRHCKSMTEVNVNPSDTVSTSD